jgi:hypothetical protein
MKRGMAMQDTQNTATSIDAYTGALTLGSASFVEDGALWLTTLLPSSAVQEKRDHPLPSRRLY